MTEPKVQRFNAIVEAFDMLTLYRYDRVHSLPALLGHALLELGHENVLVKKLCEGARALGYFSERTKI